MTVKILYHRCKNKIINSFKLNVRNKNIIAKDIFVRTASPGGDILEELEIFNRIMAVNGHYFQDEVPYELQLIRCTCYYFDQICNGGHEQYISNSRWAPYENRLVKETLNYLAVPSLINIFEEVFSYVEENQERRKAIQMRCGFSDLGDGKIDEFLLKKDGEFYEIKDLSYKALKSYTNNIPYLIPISQKEWMSSINSLIDSNPSKARRVENLPFRYEMQKRFNENLPMISKEIGIYIDDSYVYNGILNINGSSEDVILYALKSGDLIACIDDGKIAMVCSYPEGKLLLKFFVSSHGRGPV